VGAVVGIVAVVGSFGLVRGIDDALAEPIRSGQIFDTEIFPNRQNPPEQLAEVVAQDPEVDAVAIQQRVPVDVAGAGLPVYGIEGITGDTTFRLTSGRAPTTPDEAAIGPATAKSLDLGVGDELTIGGANGSTVTVVGIALLPQTPHTSFDQGVWMTTDGVDELPPDISEGIETTVAVSLVDGGDLEAFRTRVTDATGISEIEDVALPQDVVNLENIRNLPVYLAIFLAFLGVAALGHVLVTAARRRRQDLAVLRALGFRPVQAGACLAWQATVVAIVGLVIGIPLGIIVGRLTWKWVADSTPLLYVPPVALVVALLAIPTALLLANALALLPARTAARIRPAQVLRTE
jgi:ABC-type antimicrobial peptide transport system permease subunit